MMGLGVIPTPSLNSAPTSRNDPCVCPAVDVEILTLALSLSERERRQKLETKKKHPLVNALVA
jgi:hypothetical protein